MPGLGKPVPISESLATLGAQTGTSGKEAVSDTKKDPLPESLFEPRKPLYSFDSIILSPDVHLQFDALKSRIHNHKIIYEDWGLNEVDPCGKKVAFNLYGPPGTGKTMCVEAMAYELGKSVIDVSYAEIESKFVGETGKNITAAFKAAGKTGALLFFDEADSILGRRMTSVTQAADHGVNVARAVMLKQLDAFDGVVAFASNLPKNFDPAFVRRILQHIEIPLPGADERLGIWRKMIPESVPGRQDLNWNELSKQSETLAGGDIKNAAITALSVAASRSGKSQRVMMQDLLPAIKHVCRARRHVGAHTMPPKD